MTHLGTQRAHIMVNFVVCLLMTAHVDLVSGQSRRSTGAESSTENGGIGDAVAQGCVTIPGFFTCQPTGPTPIPTPPIFGSGCDTIQQQIQALPSQGGAVRVPSGVFTCAAPLVMDRDHVELRGDGPATILRLANGANAPVVIVGQALASPSITRRFIVVGDLAIDGNRTNQSTDTWSAVPALRNHGIVVRRAEDVTLERVTVFSARASGLVTELGSRRVTLRDVTAYDNQVDGLAGYETEDSVFSGLHLHDNVQGAGLSFDRRFTNNVISDAVLVGNHTNGIALRDARYNVFNGVQVRQSGEHGVFLAQATADPATAPSFNLFTGLFVVDSGGAGIRLNDPSIVETDVYGIFAHNAGGCSSFEGTAHVSGGVGCQP